MNFLSHYYFERENLDSNMVIGTVLPDLVKNSNKDWNLYPQKNEQLFTSDAQLNSILNGWKRHLEVDLIFHSSDFFKVQMAILKELLLPILNHTPVRPSFLAHIGVELMLDHLLLINGKIQIDSFYNHLASVDESVIKVFLSKCGKIENDNYFKFMTSFISSRYLFSYQKIENISYALERICMRLWPKPFNEDTVFQLTEKLEIYKPILEKCYLIIFNKIDAKLKK